jgi:hypothetical protein
MVMTMAATRPAIARALIRRTSSSSNGSRMYSWASMAIDQNARLGLRTEKMSCTRRPYTTADFPTGAGERGWASTYQVITRLNPSAAQYGGRIRHALRCAYVAIDPSRHPERAGARPSEKPDSMMKIATPPRP